MKLSLLLSAFCCCVVLFSACKKNENGDDNKSATQKMLEDGKWQMTAHTATLTYKGADTTLDMYAEMDECDKDDFIQFFSNGTATQDENTNKCADDQQVESAAWALLNNESKLALVDSNPDTFDLELTAAQMKIKNVKPNSSGTPVTYISTYKNIK